MKFAIISHVFHKIENEKFYAYEPYVREMNLWFKNVSLVKVVAPVSKEEVNEIESNYNFNNITINQIPSFNLLTISNKLKAIFKIPIIILQIIKVCFWADHIHLRCPGNIGLIGCIIQVFFPFKKKTVKYAGNWDPKSEQPFSYRLQKWIISNTYFTRNCKVLVYGEWENKSKNITPFFTASYKEDEISVLPKKELNKTIKFLYVGAFTVSKQPMLSVLIVKDLISDGYNVELNMFGDGSEFNRTNNYIKKNNLQNSVFLHGNKSKEVIKNAFQESHFLLFISKSEGWPKVVAEAMFWSCLPISSKVSCVPFMLDFGKRGSIVNSDKKEILLEIKNYFSNPKDYYLNVKNAKNWSQKYTLDKFSLEISKLF